MRAGHKRKRVCVVMGSHFSAIMGGAQYQAKCVVERLRETGRHEIFYLAREFDPDYRAQDYVLKRIVGPKGLRNLGFVFDTRALLNLLHQISPDVIYQRGLKPYTGVVAWYASKHHSRSIFHIAHDYSLMPLHMKTAGRLQWLKRVERWMGEYGLRNVDSIIAQTRDQAELLATNYGRTAAAVIPNFHPFPEALPQKPARPVRVLWVANFKSVKRPEIFVRLAKDCIAYDGIEFVMIGRPGARDRYGELLGEMEKTPNLRYLGEQPIEEVNRLLSAGHIFVNTSCAEGFPNTFIQAWMRRVPTVSLDVNPDQVLSDGRIGFWAGSYDLLRHRVVELAEDNALRERMGEAARTYARQTHSPQAAAKLLEIIDDE